VERYLNKTLAWTVLGTCPVDVCTPYPSSPIKIAYRSLVRCVGRSPWSPTPGPRVSGERSRVRRCDGLLSSGPRVSGKRSRVRRCDGLLSSTVRPCPSLCVVALSSWRSLSWAVEPVRLRLHGHWTSRSGLHAAYVLTIASQDTT